MDKGGYNRPLFLGSIAAGGTLGILIPPSINMIIYAVLTDTSVADLYAAGFIPGFLLAGLGAEEESVAGVDVERPGGGGADFAHAGGAEGGDEQAEPGDGDGEGVDVDPVDAVERFLHEFADAEGAAVLRSEDLDVADGIEFEPGGDPVADDLEERAGDGSGILAFDEVEVGEVGAGMGFG
jgi:hypothetical protein